MKTITQKKIGFANVMKKEPLHMRPFGKKMGRSKASPMISRYHCAEYTIVAKVDFSYFLYVEKEVKD